MMPSEKQSHLTGEEGWDDETLLKNHPKTGMSKKVLVMFGIRPLRPSILGHVDPQLMSDPEVRQFAYISERCLSGGFRPLPSRFWASTKNQLGDGWHLNWWPQSWRNSGIDQPVVVQAICSPLDFWKLKVCAGFSNDDPMIPQILISISFNIPYQSWFCLLFPIL